MSDIYLRIELMNDAVGLLKLELLHALIPRAYWGRVPCSNPSNESVPVI